MHSKCLITFTSCHSSLFRKKIFSNFTVLVVKFFNPYQAKVLILYPLKTPETFGFLVFSGEYKIGTLARDGLRHRSCVFFCWLWVSFCLPYGLSPNFTSNMKRNQAIKIPSNPLERMRKT